MMKKGTLADCSAERSSATATRWGEERTPTISTRFAIAPVVVIADARALAVYCIFRFHDAMLGFVPHPNLPCLRNTLNLRHFDERSEEKSRNGWRSLPPVEMTRRGALVGCSAG
jgi:hypothetical protein